MKDSSRLKIGIDSSRVSVTKKTGTEYYSLNIISALIRCDRQNQYILYIRDKDSFSDISLKNVSRVNISVTRLWTQLGLAAELFRSRPDVLFIPAHTLPIIRPRGLRTVVTIHDLGYEYLEQYHKFPGRLYLNKSTEYAAGNADRLIAVSEATKKDLITKLGVTESKIDVVYEGYDDKIFKKSSEQEKDRVKKKYNLGRYLLFVGTIQPRKNIENIIRAFEEVSKKDDIDIVICGKSGWLNSKIYSLPAELGVEDRVRFIDYVSIEDLPGLYSGSEGFVFPSLFEGFGLPVIEAFACGTPVLTSNVSSLPEVAGDAAILVDPYDVESISQGMYQLVSNKKLTDQLREKGFARAKTFSWEKAAKQTLEVLEKTAR